MFPVNPVGRLAPTPKPKKVVRKKRSARDSNRDQREHDPDPERHDEEHRGSNVDETV